MSTYLFRCSCQKERARRHASDDRPCACTRQCGSSRDVVVGRAIIVPVAAHAGRRRAFRAVPASVDGCGNGCGQRRGFGGRGGGVVAGVGRIAAAGGVRGRVAAARRVRGGVATAGGVCGGVGGRLRRGGDGEDARRRRYHRRRGVLAIEAFGRDDGNRRREALGRSVRQRQAQRGARCRLGRRPGEAQRAHTQARRPSSSSFGRQEMGSQGVARDSDELDDGRRRSDRNGTGMDSVTAVQCAVRSPALI
jgi:hypothetical protein